MLTAVRSADFLTVSREMRVARGDFDPAMTEKPADDRQALAERERPRGKAVAKIVQLDNGRRKEPRSVPTECRPQCCRRFAPLPRGSSRAPDGRSAPWSRYRCGRAACRVAMASFHSEGGNRIFTIDYNTLQAELAFHTLSPFCFGYRMGTFSFPVPARRWLHVPPFVHPIFPPSCSFGHRVMPSRGDRLDSRNSGHESADSLDRVVRDLGWRILQDRIERESDTEGET